jgi:nucleotide-binding universal stress UspA family protein
MTPTGNVLVPLDGSAHATAAMPVAREFAELLHATIVVLHVTDDAVAGTALVERMRLSREDARGLVIERRPGMATEAIVQEAAERHAAMIVMCPQIRTDLPLRAFGTVAAGVLRQAPCPVVLVPSARGRKDWALRRLLVPQDGTPTSAATIGSATDFASMTGAKLVVLHVATPGGQWPTEPGTFISPRYVDQPQHEWPAWGQEFLDRLRAIGGAKDGVDVRLAVAQGEAAAAIIDFAQQSDLVVLGWRGVLDPDRAQTMRSVIRKSVCPVIVFRLEREGGRQH